MMNAKGTLQVPMTRQELASLTSELPHIRALLVVSLQRPWRRIVVNVARKKPGSRYAGKVVR